MAIVQRSRLAEVNRHMEMASHFTTDAKLATAERQIIHLYSMAGSTAERALTMIESIIKVDGESPELRAKASKVARTAVNGYVDASKAASEFGFENPTRVWASKAVQVFERHLEQFEFEDAQALKRVMDDVYAMAKNGIAGPLQNAIRD